MIQGIESFKKRFEKFDGQYVIIGGTACDMLMSDVGVDFRATKDIDIVIIVESLTAEFGREFWDYIIEAGYEHKNKSTGEAEFYRFSHPISSEYPFMIEIFSRKPDGFALPDNAVLTPLLIDEELSSLSAILLNENYYEFIKTGITNIDGIAILDAIHIIPLKAKAWADLKEKKQINPSSVDSKDIKKHKNDIFRLSTLLTPDMQIEVTNDINDDIELFLNEVINDNVNLKQLGIRGMNINDAVIRIRKAYLRK